MNTHIFVLSTAVLVTASCAAGPSTIKQSQSNVSTERNIRTETTLSEKEKRAFADIAGVEVPDFAMQMKKSCEDIQATPLKPHESVDGYLISGKECILYSRCLRPISRGGYQFLEIDNNSKKSPMFPIGKFRLSLEIDGSSACKRFNSYRSKFSARRVFLGAIPLGKCIGIKQVDKFESKYQARSLTTSTIEKQKKTLFVKKNQIIEIQSGKIISEIKDVTYEDKNGSSVSTMSCTSSITNLPELIIPPK